MSKESPTEAPKPTPTETLKQKWGKVWVIGEGMGTGGPESGLTKGEERFGNFIEQITKQLEVKGESLKQTELFIGAFPKPEFGSEGRPQKELSPSIFFLSIKDQKKLPYSSEKKGFDMDKFRPAFDLASARFNIWEGEKGYEGEQGYGKLFVEEEINLTFL